MIKASLIPTLYQYLGAIFEYGLKNNYSFKSIQERISYSDMFKQLEDSDYYFLYDRTLKKEIELIYSTDIEDEDIKDISSKMLWLGEAYTRLFFKFHKSIFYIFLYIPLEKMVSYYPIYHEMDWNQLYDSFTKEIESVTLLRKLLNEYHISLAALSTLTGIGEPTLKRYVKDDNNLYHASYSFIYSIAVAFKINSNVLIQNINNYTDSKEYDFDKNNKEYSSYLGLFLVSYYTKITDGENYDYDQKNNMFITSDKVIKVISNDKNINIKSIVDSQNKLDNKRFALIIFDYVNSYKSYKDLFGISNSNIDDLFVISNNNIIHIGKRNYMKEIPNNVYNSLIARAKSIIGGDFAI